MGAGAQLHEIARLVRDGLAVNENGHDALLGRAREGRAVLELVGDARGTRGVHVLRGRSHNVRAAAGSNGHVAWRAAVRVGRLYWNLQRLIRDEWQEQSEKNAEINISVPGRTVYALSNDVCSRGSYRVVEAVRAGAVSAKDGLELGGGEGSAGGNRHAHVDPLAVHELLDRHLQHIQRKRVEQWWERTVRELCMEKCTMRGRNRKERTRQPVRRAMPSIDAIAQP